MDQVTTDQVLLSRWALERDESAFAELVARHSGLVYSAAVRQTANANMAQDVAQAVFVVLAKKADSLRRHTMLSGWLYQTTRLTALNAVRLEQRRRRNENSAARQRDESTRESSWQEMAPLLDEAMARLSDSDRQLILSRYFENRSHNETARQMGLSENTAGRRILRALEKLRTHFRSKGVVIPAAGIGTILAGHAVQSAPAGVIATISAGATVGTSALASTTMSMMAVAKMKIAAVVLVGTAIVAGAGVVIVKSQATQTAAVAPASQPIAAETVVPATPVPATLPASRPAVNDGHEAVQIAAYQALVTSVVIDDIRAVTKPVESRSTKIELVQGNAEQVRTRLAARLDSRDIIRVPSELSFVSDIEMRYRTDPMLRPFVAQGGWDKIEPEPRTAYSFYPSPGDEKFGVKLRNSTAQLNVKAPLHLQMSGNYATRTGSRKDISVDANIEFIGAIPAGQSLVGLIHLGQRGSFDVWYLAVWEVIECDQEHMDFVQTERDQAQWIRRGLAGAYAEAEDGLKWKALASDPDKVIDPKFRKTTPSGNVIEVYYISDSAHRYRGWAGNGAPVTQWVNGPGPGIAAYFRITTNENPSPANLDFVDMSDKNPNRRIGLASGEWKTMGTLDSNMSLQLNGIRYKALLQLQHNQTGADGLTHRISRVDFLRTDLPDTQVRLVPVYMDGSEHPNESSYKRWALYSNPPSNKEFTDYNTYLEVDLDQLDHFILQGRPIEWVDFAGIAMEPNMALAKPLVTTAKPKYADDSPQKAILDYYAALSAGNPEKAMSLMTFDPGIKPLIVSGLKLEMVKGQVERTVNQKWGKAKAERALTRYFSSHTANSEHPDREAEMVKLVNPDCAALGSAPTTIMCMERTKGQWKLKLNFAPMVFTTSIRELMERTTNEIAGYERILNNISTGKYADAYDLQDDLDKHPDWFSVNPDLSGQNAK